ncbi:MAG: phage tail protein [Lachnospiraceae bacterium]|nr:phage tail protein [Lachnospiraceae bacterium]
MPRYSIRKNRFTKGAVNGFTIGEKGELTLSPEEMYHILLLKGIDSTVAAGKWGRISFHVTEGEDMVYSLYVLAIDNPERAADIDACVSDPDIPAADRLLRLRKEGAKRFVKTPDCLLYDLNGRFLFIAFEVTGQDSLTLSDIVVDSVGDNFMATFPEVYRERNSFFHRYMSIFSSIYNDFQREIDSMYQILDLETCSEEQLIVYGEWLGITLREGLLPVHITRQLVREAYELNRMKGTRAAIERVLTIILGEKPVIIEHNQVKSMLKEEDKDYLQQFEIRSPYDVTILIRRHLTEALRHQIVFVLEQFKPVRIRFSLSQMDERPMADSNSYLGVNTVLPGAGEAGRLNENASLDGAVVLQ